MNRKSILVLILLTAIFAAVIYSMLKKEPLIEKVIITDKKSLSDAEMQNTAPGKTDDFILNNNSGIYAVFVVKDLKPGNNINIKWFISRESKEELIQDDSVTTKKEGSGQIATGLIMKNASYESGKYRLQFAFNNGTPTSVNFTVK